MERRLALASSASIIVLKRWRRGNPCHTKSWSTHVTTEDDKQPNRRRSDPREGDSSSSVSSTFSYPRPPSYPYPYPQPCPYPYPQPYSHPPPYPSHFIQLPVYLGMSTSGQIGELQVCMYLYYNFIIMCSPLI